jgi:hypothetical protein
MSAREYLVNQLIANVGRCLGTIMARVVKIAQEAHANSIPAGSGPQ